MAFVIEPLNRTHSNNYYYWHSWRRSVQAAQYGNRARQRLDRAGVGRTFVAVTPGVKCVEGYYTLRHGSSRQPTAHTMNSPAMVGCPSR
jgi:hypothetical protein